MDKGTKMVEDMTTGMVIGAEHKLGETMMATAMVIGAEHKPGETMTPPPGTNHHTRGMTAVRVEAADDSATTVAMARIIEVETRGAMTPAGMEKAFHGATVEKAGAAEPALTITRRRETIHHGRRMTTGVGGVGGAEMTVLRATAKNIGAEPTKAEGIPPPKLPVPHHQRRLAPRSPPPNLPVPRRSRSLGDRE